jgi:hypothetical protein
MRSPRGFVAAVVLLLALPVSLLHAMVVGAGAEIVVHAALALGSILMAGAVFDFRTSRWIAWAGCAAAAALAAIFLLQGLSELIPNAMLTQLAYQALGQRVEGWLVDLFLLWCIAVLLLDSQGKTKILGSIAISIVVCVEAYANGLSLIGTSLNVEAPSLKLLFLLPFGWLLLESRKASHLPDPVSAVVIGRPGSTAPR